MALVLTELEDDTETHGKADDSETKARIARSRSLPTGQLEHVESDDDERTGHSPPENLHQGSLPVRYAELSQPRHRYQKRTPPLVDYHRSRYLSNANREQYTNTHADQESMSLLTAQGCAAVYMPSTSTQVETEL